MTEEKWKPVVGFEGIYEVSNLGRVRSLDRVTSYGRAIKGRILKLQKDWKGYPFVRVWNGGTERTAMAHLLVLKAFVGPRPEGMEGCHNDGNPDNCRPSNLRWGTPESNRADMRRHGTIPCGERQWRAKLNSPDIGRIFDLRRSGCSSRQIADWLGVVGERSIRKVLRGDAWSHLGLAKPIGPSIFGPAPGQEPPMQVNP